jgi:CRP-like cAMP-binding protein
MQEEDVPNEFFIWGIDNAPYGPVELPVLVDWVRDQRVVPETWIFVRMEGRWKCASEIADLEMIFKRKTTCATAATVADGAAITPGALRRIKILAGLSDAQLNELVPYLEPIKVPQWTVIFKQGDAGDAMFLILEGELRARTYIGGKETILATFGIGEFFGEMSLFDHGPRSADVVANVECSMLRIPAAAFEKLVQQVPALATPFLQATARTLAARIRADNKRLDRISQQFRMSGATQPTA